MTDTRCQQAATDLEVSPRIRVRNQTFHGQEEGPKGRQELVGVQDGKLYHFINDDDEQDIFELDGGASRPLFVIEGPVLKAKSISSNENLWPGLHGQRSPNQIFNDPSTIPWDDAAII